MITPNEKRTQFILDLLVKEDYNFVWVADTKTFEFETYKNENASAQDLPERGNALELLDYIREYEVPEESRKIFDRKLSAKKILKNLKRKKSFEIEFEFILGKCYVKFFHYDKEAGEVIVCSRILDDTVDVIPSSEHDALIVMELDARKHFVIRNINENIVNVFNVSLLKFSRSFMHDAFAGFLPEDRIAVQSLFLNNAFDGQQFQGDFKVSLGNNVFQMVHLDVLVKRIKRSYMYYVTVKKIKEPEILRRQFVHSREIDSPRRKVHSFDVDLVTGTGHLGMEMAEYYKLDTVVFNFPAPLIRKHLIHPDDAEIINTMMHSIRNGSSHEEADVRVKNPDVDNYEWRSLIMNVINDDFGVPVRAIGYSEDISYYKDQEARFHEVLEMCGFTTWDYNLESHKITNSGRLKEIFGLMDEHLSNVPESLFMSGCIHNDDIDILREIHRKISEGEKTVDCEIRARNINGGNFIWYRLRYTLVTDKNGNFQKAVGSTTDINEQKVAELSYEYEAKTLYEMQGDTLVEKCCVNLTKDEVVSVSSKQDVEFTFLRKKYSEVLSTMKEFSANEEMGRMLWTKLNTENLLNFFAQGNKTFSFVHRRMVENSNLQWVSTKVNMYQDPKTSEIIAFIYTYDINRKKLSQEALELIGTSDFDLVAIIDVIGGGAIFLHDNDIMSRVPNWDCGDYDAYFEKYAERIKPFLETEEDYILLHDKIKISSLVRQLERNNSYEVLIKQHKPDASNTIVYRTTFRYLDREQSNIIMCMSDITTALAEEQEKEQVLKNALEQANVASHAKTDFLARMSHDIRTPLNGIMGMTQLAMDEDDVDLIHEYLEKIDTSSKFLLGLLNDILDMSRIEKGVINLESDVYSLDEFKSSLESIIVPLCRNKDIKLNVQIDGNYSFITDRQKFNQIFFNLLSNSVKFTEVGGTIDLLAQNIQVQKNTEGENAGLLLIDFIVRDYGCGMTEEFQKKMFEAFSQERNSMTNMNQGSGLGLAIVKSLVEKMGGSIEVWSSTAEENHGTRTTVHMVLPLAE